jgi:hypothetical protein
MRKSVRGYDKLYADSKTIEKNKIINAHSKVMNKKLRIVEF